MNDSVPTPAPDEDDPTEHLFDQLEPRLGGIEQRLDDIERDLHIENPDAPNREQAEIHALRHALEQEREDRVRTARQLTSIEQRINRALPEDLRGSDVLSGVEALRSAYETAQATLASRGPVPTSCRTATWAVASIRTAMAFTVPGPSGQKSDEYMIQWVLDSIRATLALVPEED